MKVFHGTNAKFERFDDRYLSGLNFGSGFYFTGDFDTARWFCHLKDEDGGFVYECSVAASNPFEIRNPKHARLVAEKLDLNWHIVKADKSFRDQGSGYDRKLDSNEFYKKISSILSNTLFRGDNFDRDRMHIEIHRAIRDLGFDSVSDERNGYVMVFRAAQIKILKTHKIGKYDSEAARKFWDR